MLTEGQNWIDKAKRRWQALKLLRIIVLSFAVALFLATAAIYLIHLKDWIALLLFPFALLSVFLFKSSWKITAVAITRDANNHYPALEESADLLLKNPAELSLLQQLQLSKIESILPTLPLPNAPVKKLYQALLVFAAAILLSFGLSKIHYVGSSKSTTAQVLITAPTVKENILPEISDFSATILPPTYTGNEARQQRQFAIRAEAGAKVSWKINTNIGINKLQMVFNDREIINLKPSNTAATAFNYSKSIVQPGFYQLILNGKKSDLYQIEIIPDLPVTIKMIQPKQRTTIDIGQPQHVNLNAILTDDYGIRNAYISATMASGKGEGVSFTEKKIVFNTGFGNQKRMNLSKMLDLRSLGMKPGDELYFFINAMDNHGQASRSDMYFATIVDTTELMSLAGMASGVNLVPEYFRSQRQLIIDTEKLLKDKNTIATESFKTQSNDLGTDQKLLRLRYGQFLGEENETEIGGDHDDHDHDKGKAEPEKFGDVSAIMDKYAHKHDIAEDATFFEPEMKAKLKAVLTEMWNAELRLRTYKPQEALPYEYKALRLLKDLQQQSRAYVAKTTVKTAALKPEKRLTGELDKIMQPVQKMTLEQKEQRNAQLKTALATLESRKKGKKFTENDRLLLGQVEKYMIAVAADHPSTYLSALGKLRKLATTTSIELKTIEQVQLALQKMIITEPAKPQQKATLPAAALYNNYFKNLKNTNR
jgi:hypothetical protein